MFGASCCISGVTDYKQKAMPGWKDVWAGHRGAGRRRCCSPVASATELRIAELERLLGRKQLEVDFLKRAFEHVRGERHRVIPALERRNLPRHRSIALARRGRTDRGRAMPDSGGEPGWLHRYLHQAKPKQADMLLRARLQELAVAHHRLRGYRMLTALLRREGQLVNRKRVLRLMREDNLLSLRRSKYVFTTDSAHTLPIYPNLARHAKLTAPNQLWVSDITFIRLRDEFIYLAVVLGRLLSPRRRLGPRTNPACGVGTWSVTDGSQAAQLESRGVDSPLGSRCSICVGVNMTACWTTTRSR